MPLKITRTGTWSHWRDEVPAWAEPDGTSQDQSCSSDSHTGRATCVFAVRNLQEDRFKIHTSLLRSSKLTLFSANQEKAERRSYCSCVSSGEGEEERRAGGFFSAADWSHCSQPDLVTSVTSDLCERIRTTVSTISFISVSKNTFSTSNFSPVSGEP